jgi:hypothetical protein
VLRSPLQSTHPTAGAGGLQACESRGDRRRTCSRRRRRARAWACYEIARFAFERVRLRTSAGRRMETVSRGQQGNPTTPMVRGRTATAIGVWRRP